MSKQEQIELQMKSLSLRVFEFQKFDALIQMASKIEHKELHLFFTLVMNYYKENENSYLVTSSVKLEIGHKTPDKPLMKLKLESKKRLSGNIPGLGLKYRQQFAYFIMEELLGQFQGALATRVLGTKLSGFLPQVFNNKKIREIIDKNTEEKWNKV